MPWTSHHLQHSFQVLINQLVDFHDQCGKSKNIEHFRNIRAACEMGLNFIYADEMPDAPDTMVSSISGVIKTQLNEIGVKKEGSQDNADFIANLLSSMEVLGIFRNECQSEIRKYGMDSQVQVSSNGMETRVSMNHAMTNLISKDELTVKIASLGDMPAQTISCMTFFKRPAMHYPKTTAASAITGIIGTGYAGLTVLSHYVGPALDTLIHADQTGITHQAIFAGVLLLTSISLFSAAAIGTCTTAPENNDEANENSPLFRMT